MRLKPEESIWLAALLAIVVVVAVGALTFRLVETPAHRPFDYGTRAFVPGKSHYAVEPYERVELPRPESTRPAGGARP